MESNHNYNCNTPTKQPLVKKSLIRGIGTQDAILPDGSRKRLLVLDQDQDKYKDFVMSFRARGGDYKLKNIDPAAVGIFFHLATTVMNHHNVCNITMDECADMVGKSVPSVKKWFRELIDSGYIKRIKPGTYMLSPYKTIKIRKKYFGILETAWKTGRINDIQPAIEKLDEKTREETARNKALVKKAEASVLKKRLTIPEAPIIAIDAAQELEYMMEVKEEEYIQQRIELAEKLASKQHQPQ